MGFVKRVNVIDGTGTSLKVDLVPTCCYRTSTLRVSDLLGQVWGGYRGTGINGKESDR